jgi:EmrB/QacA subfamily drug resistance transporter
MAAIAPAAPVARVHRDGLGGLGLAVVLLGQLVVVLDFSIVNVALPNISTQLNVSSTSVQWAVTAYAITFGGLLVLGGRLADLFGRRRLFIAGLIGFAVASAAGGMATSFPVLVGARAVQGIAAAAVAPAALSILTTSFPQGPRRTRVLGYYGITASVGFVLGLVLGGVLVETVDWRGVFFVNVPICFIAAAVSTRLVPAGARAATRAHLDAAGALLVTAGVAALVYAPTAGADNGWTSAPFLGALVVSALFLMAFIAHERRTPQPLMPMSMFNSRPVVAGTAVTFLVGAWVAAEVLILSLFSQQVLGYSPLIAGLLVIPQGIGGMLRGLAGPRVVAQVGVKWFLALSAAITAAGLALLLRFPATSHYPLLGVVLLVIGFGTTSALFAATIAGTTGISDDRQGVAGALINAARQVGSAVGVATLLAVAAVETRAYGASPTALADGYRATLLVTAALALLGTIISLVVFRKNRPESARAASRRLPIRRQTLSGGEGLQTSEALDAGRLAGRTVAEGLHDVAVPDRLPLPDRRSRSTSRSPRHRHRRHTINGHPTDF